MPYEILPPEAPTGRYEILPPENTPSLNLAPEGMAKVRGYDPTDSIAGNIRGYGSGGATIVDFLRNKFADPILAGTPPAMRPQITGELANAPRGPEMRTGMDAGLQAMGADPSSTQFKTNRLLGEVQLTAGIPGGLARGLRAIPGAAAALPTLLTAIESSGMTANGVNGAYGLANRIAGGAVSGGAMAGAVNPEDASTGAMIGGAFPVTTKVLGAAGDWLGGIFKGGGGGSPPNATTMQTAKESMDAGFKIPPSMLDPSLKNRVMESTSGKIATQQMFSNKNQALIEDLAHKALPGLPADAPLTFETMSAYRSAQHQAGYEPLRQVGVIPAGPQFNQALDDIANQFKGKGTIPAIADAKQSIIDMTAAHKSGSFDVGDAVDAVASLREDANALFKSPIASEKAKAKATKAIADAYEGAIDNALSATGQTDLLTAYRNARENIAKSFTVEGAIKEGAGTIDARKIAAVFQKNPKMLSGDLLTIGKFANTFPKAAIAPETMGSPGVHNLTSMFSTGGGAAGAGLGAWVGGPVGATLGAVGGAAYPYVVPPMIRSRMMSEAFQRNLLNQGPQVQGLLGQSIDQAMPLAYRFSPLLAGGGQ